MEGNPVGTREEQAAQIARGANDRRGQAAAANERLDRVEAKINEQRARRAVPLS